MPLRAQELRWITNRKKIFAILLSLRDDEITISNAETQIRKILYSS